VLCKRFKLAQALLAHLIASFVCDENSYVQPQSTTYRSASHYRIMSTSPTELPKACGHPGCQLSTRDGCCCMYLLTRVAFVTQTPSDILPACLDRRPLNPSGYMQYIDGRGWQSGGSRQAMYCPGCRAGAPRPRPASFLPASVVPCLEFRAIGGPDVLPLGACDAATPSNPTWRERPASPPSGPPLSADTPFSLSNLCKICFDAPPDALLLPCAHLVSCASCATRLFLKQSSSGKESRGASNREITGRDLISRVSAFGRGVSQLGFEALRSLHSSSGGQCPICRSEVRRWIKVYMA